MKFHIARKATLLTAVVCLICLPTISCKQDEPGTAGDDHSTANTLQNSKTDNHAHADNNDHDAGHSHDAHDHSEHDHYANTNPPDSYATAVSRMSLLLATFSEHDRHDNDAEIRENCDQLIAICSHLPELAMKPSSGVERKQVKLVNTTSKAFAAIAQQMHDADHEIAPSELSTMHKKMAEFHNVLLSCSSTSAIPSPQNDLPPQTPQNHSHSDHDHNDHNHGDHEHGQNDHSNHENSH